MTSKRKSSISRSRNAKIACRIAEVQGLAPAVRTEIIHLRHLRIRFGLMWHRLQPVGFDVCKA
jgi:hypothetical protein